MPETTRIRGYTQIKDQSIKNIQIALDAAIATTKLEEGSEFLKRDGTVALTSSLDAGLNLITNLPDPVSGSDVVCKRFADDAYLQEVLVRTLITTNPPDCERMSFALSQTPVEDSEKVYLTGMIQEPGENSDYVISGNVITFHSPPDILDRIRVLYIYDNKIYDDVIINSSPGGIGDMEIGVDFEIG